MEPLTHLCLVFSSASSLWADSSPIKGHDSVLFFLTMSSIRQNPSQNVNSVDPDQTLRSAASDLCLHYLPISLSWDARHGLKRARISHY